MGIPISYGLKLMPERFVFSLDYDGCTDRKREDLIAKFKELAEAGQQVVIMVGSNRQDMATNQTNLSKSGNGSCFRAFTEMVNAINAEIDEINAEIDEINAKKKASPKTATRIQFDTFLMADVESQRPESLKAGRSMQRILELEQEIADQPSFEKIKQTIPDMAKDLHEIIDKLISREQLDRIYDAAVINDRISDIDSALTLIGEPPSQGFKKAHEQLMKSKRHLEKVRVEYQQATAMADESKISTLYTQLHHLAKQGTPFTFTFYDDKLEIIENAHKFFQKNPGLIPEGVTVVFEHRDNIEILKSNNEALTRLTQELKKTTTDDGLRSKLNEILTHQPKLLSSRSYDKLDDILKHSEDLSKDTILKQLNSEISGKTEGIEIMKIEATDAKEVSGEAHQITGTGDIDVECYLTSSLVRRLMANHVLKAVDQQVGISDDAMEVRLIETIRSEGIKSEVEKQALGKTTVGKTYAKHADDFMRCRELIEEKNTAKGKFKHNNCQTVLELQTEFRSRASNTYEYTQKLYGLGARLVDNVKHRQSGTRSRTNELQIYQKLIDYLQGKPVLGFTAQERAGV